MRTNHGIMKFKLCQSNQSSSSCLYLTDRYTYNLRSWLTGIESPLFKEGLSYHDGTVPQWGGNISAIQWGEGALHNTYSFMYDTHSRLLTANYSNASSVGLYSEIYNYDLNGNMLRHVRGSQPLVMNYSGNRLTSAGAATFEYDAKGRQVMSSYGSGLSTEYNILDLPQRQTTGEGTVVDYKYAFDGRKLQEKVTAGASVTQRDYSGEFLYEGGVLKKILFDGGYVINDVSGPVYMFFLRDHLGSVRAVVSETGAVQQMNHYFPYGDLFPNTSNDSSGNRYRYTGKESGDEIGLYDFSARFLHTRFGRFTTIDPLAEKYPDISPYAYCNGNPVNFVDPDGQIPHAVIFAAVGAGMAAVTAIIQGKSASEVFAATVGGAVDGALSSIGGTVALRVFMGAAGGGAGNLAEQWINKAFGNQAEFDKAELGVSVAFGAATGTIDGISDTVGKHIEDFYSSDETIKSMAKEIKDNFPRRITDKKATKEAKIVAEEAKQAEKNMVENTTQVITYTWNFYYNIQDE